MFDVYDAHNKLIASHALLRDAIANLLDIAIEDDNKLVSLGFYFVERETNMGVAIDTGASKLRFVIGAKGN
jgi:hypothetical protein